MAPISLRKHFLESTRGRIVGLLRRGELTVDEMAAALGLTHNAIRVQLASMERDGLIRLSGRRPGTTRPSHVFEITPQLEQLLSRAYIPFLTQLVRVFASRSESREFNALMREAGRGLAAELPFSQAAGAHLRKRVAGASALLNSELGALTEVEDGNGHLVIRGHDCPLAALTGKHPGVCQAIESLLAQVLGTRVHECCDRDERPRCCFEVYPSTEPRKSRARRARR